LFLLLVVGAGLAFAGPALAQDKPFDLKVDLDLSGVTDKLREGDTLQVILRPAVQYGMRTAPGQPIVLERSFTPGETLQTVRFQRALDELDIYRLELRIVRNDRNGNKDVRYLSALYKLPRTPVDRAIPMRLHQSFQRDERHNLVQVVRDPDGVFRVQIFAA
jgi:hypothetical protein